jgi:hypothetical protein
MELNVKERIVLLGLLPKEGDFKTLKQLREFRESIAFSDQERELLKFVTPPNGGVNWTEPGDADDKEFYTKDVKIRDSIMELIVDALVNTDKAKRLNDDTFDLYERFVINAKDNA